MCQYYALCLLLLIIGLGLLAPAAQAVETRSLRQAWLVVYDRDGNIISSKVELRLLKGRATILPFNETHWLIILKDEEVLIEIYRLRIPVGRVRVRPGEVAQARVAVADMRIRSLPGLTVELYLPDGRLLVILRGNSTYILRDVPLGMYRVRIIGRTVIETYINFRGGEVNLIYKFVTDVHTLAMILGSVALAYIFSATFSYRYGRRSRLSPRLLKTRRPPRRRTVRRRVKPREKRRREPETLTEVLLKVRI